MTEVSDAQRTTVAGRHDRLRLHGRRARPGVAERAPILHLADGPGAHASLAGRDEAALRAAAERLGFASVDTDWRRVIERDDVDLIDICTPGDTHAEIAIAALQAGKHVLCEKPLANTVAEAEADDGRRRRGGRPRACTRCAASPTGEHRRWPWPSSSSTRAGSAPSGTSGPSTCRTGSATRTRR